MKAVVTSERTYTVSFYKPGSKSQYGLNVSVSGDKKVKVMREARAMLEQVQKDALEVHKQLLGDMPTEEE